MPCATDYGWSQPTQTLAFRGSWNKLPEEQEQTVLAYAHTYPKERVLLATGRYISEGFDDARLDTLFLALPISWPGTLQQYVGRLHRLHDNKRKVIVYDYVDGSVPVLCKMYDKRVRGYKAVGYTIQKDW